MRARLVNAGLGLPREHDAKRLFSRALEPAVATSSRLLRRQAPPGSPVLSLHLLAPEQGAGPVVEVSKADWTAVDEPDDGHRALVSGNDGM